MKILGSILTSLVFVFQLSAQEKSSFNEKEIELDSTGSYSFIVSGHFYGDGTNKSGFPANTLLANLDWINESDAVMLICLGDLFKDISNDIPNYKSSLFDELEIPLFNSVGNHDLTGNIYQDNFGETFYSFEINGDIHIILDTELDNGDIKDDQLKMIKSANERSSTGEINNVFIYGHRTIWKDTYEEIDGLFEDNTQSIAGTNFENEVYPLLTDLSERSNVFVFAGSLGSAPASFFYHEDSQHNITIIATAIRTLPRDAMLEVEVNEGIVSFNTKSLTGQDLKELSDYDVEFWQNEVGTEPFNWKLIPYYIQVMLLHRFFWYGTTFVFLILLIVKLIRRKKRTS